MHKIPVNVFTGYLGSGKTTIILNLIKQLDPDYKIVWLKNEYGDDNVDSDLATQSNVRTAEILNGCLCCVLVGKLKNALVEIVEKYEPDRIIIESSGTAYPLPIVLEINQIESVQLDSVVTVIDALNFDGYKDKGEIAKMQAESTDLLIINKVSEIAEADLDEVLDDVYELNPNTPKIKSEDGFVDKELLLGIDSKLADYSDTEEHHDHNHPDAVDAFTIELNKESYSIEELGKLFKPLKDKDFIRIKGVVPTDKGFTFFNWVLGRFTLSPMDQAYLRPRLVFMGKNILNQQASLQNLLNNL